MLDALNAAHVARYVQSFTNIQPLLAGGGRANARTVSDSSLTDSLAQVPGVKLTHATALLLYVFFSLLMMFFIFCFFVVLSCGVWSVECVECECVECEYECECVSVCVC